MKKIAKKILIFSLGTAIISSTFSLAETLNVNEVEFGLKLNDRVVKLENASMVTVNERTYLPLRALCEQLLGMTVDWNEAEKTIEMWNITKPMDRGSHESPVAIGKAVTGEFLNKNDKKYIPYNISITEVSRGASVDEWLKEQYMSLDGNEYPVMETVTRGKSETKADYEKRVEKAKTTYENAVAKYEAKYQKYIDDLKQDETREFLRARVRIDIVQADSGFLYQTAYSDLVPYCGDVNVGGLQRKFVQYKVGTPKITDEANYSGRKILTNGVYEGYYIIPVYINDRTPRVMYKDGQYLALYQ